MNRNEIIIALIGVFGVIVTAVLSNYDKIFDSKSKDQTTFAYEKIDDIDLQLRYFIEVSGMRQALNEVQRVSAEKLKAKYGASEETINCVLDNQIQSEQVLELFIEVHKKHISLKQIKDLNRLYSNEAMESYNKISPLIMRDLIAGLDRLNERMIIRNQAIIGSAKRHTNEKSCST